MEKNKESFPSAIFHPERKPAAAVSTWAPSDSAAEWKQSLRPHCLFYESAEKVSASRNIISTGHLCISEPLATPWGSSAGKNTIVCKGLRTARKQQLGLVIKQEITAALRS